MPKPETARPYDPQSTALFEGDLDDKAHRLRQALLPLRAFTQRRYEGIHFVPAAKQEAYHRDTKMLEGVQQAVFDFMTTLPLFIDALWQEVQAAEAGTGLKDAQREAERGRLFERMFSVLLDVVEWPAEAVPEKYRRMQERLGQMRARYPNGLPPLPADWDAPLLARQLREPEREHEPSIPTPIPPRKSAA